MGKGGHRNYNIIAAHLYCLLIVVHPVAAANCVVKPLLIYGNLSIFGRPFVKTVRLY